MTIWETLLEIAKYTIPSIIVLIAAQTIVKRFLIAENERKRLAIFKEGIDITLRLKLQAYERLALYLERMHPRKLISRVYTSDLNVREFQTALIHTIKQEFEHNLSQQIYVSAQLWRTVTNVHEQEMNMISSIAQQLHPDAPAKELQQRIVGYIVGAAEEDIPLEIALDLLNEEAKIVLSQQS